MEINILELGKLPNPNFNKMIRVYLNEPKKPTVYLCKFLYDSNRHSAQIILRFHKNPDLQSKFYEKFKEEFNTLIKNLFLADTLADVINDDQYEFDIKDSITLEDIYTDAGDELPDAINDFDDALDVDSSENITEELQDLIDELTYIDKEDEPKEEIVYEKYKRRGFRKDAKNRLVAIKITRRDGVQATYYIRHDKLEEYTKKNKRLADGRWKYYFYTDEIEQGMKRLDDLSLKETLEGFVKKDKYGTAATMTGLKTSVEKFLDGLGVNEIRPLRSLIKGRNYIDESINVGDFYTGRSKIEFSNKRTARTGTKLLNVDIKTEEKIGNEIRNRNRIRGIYTRKNKNNRIYNSFHIDRVEGKISKDQLAYLTNAHLKTHDMISVDTNGISNPENLRKFLMVGYNWNKDTETKFRTHKNDVLQILKESFGENNPRLNKIRKLLNKSRTFRQFQLELYKTGNKELINSVFRTGIFEKYGELTGSDRLVFRNYTLSGRVSTNEKLLETFEVLRDANNDYHLGHRFAKKIEEII